MTLNGKCRNFVCIFHIVVAVFFIFSSDGKLSEIGIGAARSWLVSLLATHHLLGQRIETKS